MFDFLELLVPWRNDSFTFMLCKCGPLTISQVFLREGLKSETVVLSAVFHTLPSRTEALQFLAHCNELTGSQCLHFPWETGLWSVPVSEAPRSISLDSAFFCCVTGNVNDLWHQKSLFSLELVSEQTAPAVMGCWLCACRAEAQCRLVEKLWVHCTNNNHTISWVAQRVWEGREPAQGQGNRPLVIPGMSPSKNSRYVPFNISNTDPSFEYRYDCIMSL